MCCRFTKTSGRGIPPNPRNDIPRASKEAARHWSVPGRGSGSRTGVAAARAHRVPALVGDAGQPLGQPVGERVLRRLEAALDTLPGGIAGAGSDPWKAGGEL